MRVIGVLVGMVLVPPLLIILPLRVWVEKVGYRLAGIPEPQYDEE